MDSDSVEQEIRKEWEEYKRLRSAGALHSAVLSLAVIDHCIRNRDLALAASADWREIVDSEPLTAEELSQAMRKTSQDLARIRHILGIGTRFVFDELLLILSLRIEVELALEFLDTRRASSLPDLPLTEADQDIVEVAESRENRDAFLSAQATIRRNWKMPLKTRWLTPDLSAPATRRERGSR